MRPLFESLDWNGILDLGLKVLAVLMCIMVHEISHGLAAYLLGDPTAKTQHRLSLNPLRHIDPFGALMMVVAGFGWAKPVPVDMRYFKHPKRGMAVTALAGPVSNILLAYLALVAYFAILPFFLRAGEDVFLSGLLDFLVRVALLSIGLGIFNLIPVPPLDGFKVVGGLLPNRVYYMALRFERYGMLLLMAALYLGIFDAPLSAARQAVLNLLVHGSSWAYELVAGILF